MTSISCDYKSKFLDLFKELCYSRSSWEVWSDLMSVMACTISNAVDKIPEHFNTREEEYAVCMKKLKNLDIVSEIFNTIVIALEENPEQDLTTRPGDYFDYIRWIRNMGYDMKNEFNLFPKKFEKAHDDMSKQYIKFKDKQAREDAKRFNRLLGKLRKKTENVEVMNLNIQGLFIRLPSKLEELKLEGEALHHCVGTYMEKVQNGETMIFFIRRKEEPDKPYYTLEWKGKVVQCRGLHNCDMTPEVKAFVEIFQEKMVEYESKKIKHTKAG